MSASSRHRPVRAAPGCALAAVLACSIGAAAQQPCAGQGPDGWRCVAAPAPRNLLEPFEAKLSPDGTRLVYTRVEGGSRHLWIVDVATGTERRLTQAPGTRYEPAWSPDGARIAFWGYLPGPDGRRANGIGVADPATGAEGWVVPAPPSTFLSAPAWTPQGRIVFRLEDFVSQPATPDDAGDAQDAGPDRGGWWVADADGRNRTRLSAGPAGRPVFSPRGDAVAWIGPGCVAVAVWTADAAGGERRCIQPVPPGAVSRGRLAWPHPDTLLYAGPLPWDTASRAYLLPAAGGAPRLLASFDGEVTGVGVARDGGVAVSVYRQRSRVALLGAAGGEPEPLSLPGDPDGLWPEWHPSGLEVAFTAVPRRRGWGWFQLSMVRARLAHRGAGPSRVSYGNDTTVLAGTWSPGGSHLAAYFFSRGTATYGVARALRPDRPRVGLGPAEQGNAAGPPAWSADGARVLLATGSHAYGRLHDVPPWSLVWVAVDSLLRVEGSAHAQEYRPVPLEGFTGRPVRPRVSRDGRWIAFSSQPDAEGRGGVYVVPVEGGTVRLLAEFSTGEMLSGPEWSARGDSVFFSSPDAAGIHQLRRISRDGGEAVALTASRQHVLHPRLSPDGRTLAVTLLDVRTELWLLPARFPGVSPSPQTPPIAP